MEQQFPELDRRAVAFHEAGHAVVAKCLGLSVLTVSIVENKDLRGRVAHDWFEAIDYQDDDDDAIHRQMEKKIMAALAGPAAEAIAAPETYHRDRHSGFGGGDFDVAEGLLERIHGLRVKIAAAHLQYLELAAKAWVEQHWKAIESVSTALLEKGTLDESSSARRCGPAEGSARIHSMTFPLCRTSNAQSKSFGAITTIPRTGRRFTTLIRRLKRARS